MAEPELDEDLFADLYDNDTTAKPQTVTATSEAAPEAETPALKNEVKEEQDNPMADTIETYQSVSNDYGDQENDGIKMESEWQGNADEQVGTPQNAMVDHTAHSGIGIKEDG